MKDPRVRIHAAALHYFDAVRRAGSIRAAARRLNVASSAVNRQILALEAEVQSPLFDRLPSGLKLTAAGEILAHHVIGVLRDAERVQSELAALRGLETGHVEIVTLEGVCHRILPAAIATAHARSPRVTIGVGILGTEDIPRALAEGEAHLGLAFEVRRRPELRLIAARKFRIGAVVLPDSPLAREASLNVTGLRGHHLILPKSNFANRQQLHSALTPDEFAAGGRIEVGSIDLMKQLVLRGLGVGLMTMVGVEDDVETGRLVHVPLRQGRGFLESELGLYARADTALPLAAEVFSQHLAGVLADSQM
ncbi:MAG: LysR family transcriptional regulator [Acetobacteraceae bacterium]|nr:LysR family transcriptional regulator [Acetobacteraceae bacterium]